MSEDWRKPYRSIDAAGDPESAGAVGHRWLVEIAREEHGRSPTGLEIDLEACALYRNRELLAAYAVIRDPMNFAILLRWRPE